MLSPRRCHSFTSWGGKDPQFSLCLWDSKLRISHQELIPCISKDPSTVPPKAPCAFLSNYLAPRQQCLPRLKCPPTSPFLQTLKPPLSIKGPVAERQGLCHVLAPSTHGQTAAFFDSSISNKNHRISSFGFWRLAGFIFLLLALNVFS